MSSNNSNNANNSISSSNLSPISNDGLASLSDPEDIRDATTIITGTQDNEVVKRTASQASNIPKARTGANTPHVQIWSIQKKKPAKNFPKNTIWAAEKSGDARGQRLANRVDDWRNVPDFGIKTPKYPRNEKTAKLASDMQQELNLKYEDTQMLFNYFIRKKREEVKPYEKLSKELNSALNKESSRAQGLERKNRKLEKALKDAEVRYAKLEKEKKELEVRLESEKEVEEAVKKEKASKSIFNLYLIFTVEFVTNFKY